ncbi:hypothetical protein SPD57_04390 [Streptococcus sp. BJSWXB6CM1]|uniref:Uncharacterized protein n=1 Tax=Streptococcus fermentans TaxID=3095082 RepID=A0ABU5G2E4_9STRE|nr:MULTISPECIES: hypothetical protein [unclassified Streptococcus]MDY4346561.1 hypothetical protein [Streptococcus sp. BJSWXB5TM5]MDY4360869.1 hypothetical protein [Streptococcus sp. BJSWXB3CM3]MDY4371157.1 hypothetical protein [Streptococcus sp. BJSWXB6CM1]
MKALGVFIWAIFGAIVTAFIIQYGWNEIMVTIIPVNKISFWQAFGMNVFLSFILPTPHRKEDEDYLKTVMIGVLKAIIVTFFIWLASSFI